MKDRDRAKEEREGMRRAVKMPEFKPRHKSKRHKEKRCKYGLGVRKTSMRDERKNWLLLFISNE